MQLDHGLGHLTYSTLVHPGDTWEEMDASIRHYLPLVKRAMSPHAPFALSMRLSNASATRLTQDPAELERLAGFLADEELYLVTVNAFPYGPFKGGEVKERVYEPDWSTEERVTYTMRVADVCARLARPGISPSIQTAPLAFRPNVVDRAYVERFTDGVLRVVAHLVALERSTGVVVTLALEPEPWCYLATTADTVAYFSTWLYCAAAASRLARLAGMSLAGAHGALRRHLGVVFDVCHQAVEFEDIPTSIAALADAGIPIFKLQAAAALWVPAVDAAIVEELIRFTDTIYLTQTVERRHGRLRQFLGLGEAITAWRADPGPSEWRTHVHVPVFLDDLGAFRTTRAAIEDALAVHRVTPLSDHVEIETYTWDVLPAHLKQADLAASVERELTWVRDALVGVAA